MKSGMDREAAELAAYRRVRTEKTVAAVAGVTAVAVAAHLARKYYHRNVDQIIKEGTVIQNVRNHPMEDLGIPFYGSSSKIDNMKYRGMLGKQINGYSRSGVIANNIKATANIKRASDRTGARTLGKLLGDKSYAADLKKHLSETPILSDETKRKVLSELEQGRVGKHAYRAFNQALIDHGNPASDRVINGFYDSLKKAGYGAVSDYNDREASGYGSKTATIFFDGAKQLSKVGSRKLTDAEISSDANKSIALLTGKAAAQQFGAFGAGYAGVTAAKRYAEQKAADKAVKNYKRKHPNTKMSYSEIKRMLEEESYARK